MHSNVHGSAMSQPNSWLYRHPTDCSNSRSPLGGDLCTDPRFRARWDPFRVSPRDQPSKLFHHAFHEDAKLGALAGQFGTRSFSSSNQFTTNRRNTPLDAEPGTSGLGSVTITKVSPSGCRSQFELVKLRDLEDQRPSNSI